MGSAFMDSVNCGLKVYGGGEIPQNSKKQNLNLPHAEYCVESMQMKWCLGIVLGITHNLEVI